MPRPILLSLLSSVIWQAGAHVDAWYHINYGFEIESFFTAPHALLYAGWIAFGLIAVYGWSRSMPGYPLMVLGSALFGVGGVFDLAWHALFGFEVRIETLLTPAHSWLLISSIIGGVGLLQAALAYRDTPGRLTLPHVVVALAIALPFRAVLWSVLFSDPLAVDYPTDGAVAGQLYGFQGFAWGNGAVEASGATGIMLRSVLTSFFVVAVLRHLRPPSGSLSLLLLWEAFVIVATIGQWQNLLPVAGAAAVGELMWARIDRDTSIGYWVIGSAVPATLFALYFIVLAASHGPLDWSIHLSTGAPVLAGFYGLVAALFIVPPAFFTRQKA